METLYLIPARGGSKRLPNKNIMLLDGKPLIQHTIECAREIANDEDICISTDSEKIKGLVQNLGLGVPFLRPADLATDTASSSDVITHALRYYKSKGKEYDCVILLQPTSPLRTSTHIKEALLLYNKDIDMVVSVKQTHSPSVLCEEDKNGFLNLILNPKGKRSQTFSKYFEYNGAIYIINAKSFQKSGLNNMRKNIKYIMDEYSSVDIDTEIDFLIAEQLKKVKS